MRDARYDHLWTNAIDDAATGNTPKGTVAESAIQVLSEWLALVFIRIEDNADEYERDPTARGWRATFTYEEVTAIRELIDPAFAAQMATYRAALKEPTFADTDEETPTIRGEEDANGGRAGNVR